MGKFTKKVKKIIFKEQIHILFLIIAILALLIVLPLGVRKTNPKFVVILDYGNGYTRTFVGAPWDGMSAWDTLQQAAAHSYVTVDTMADFYPRAIDSWEDGKNGKHWALYVNDARILDRPIDAKINPGDTVVWKFE